MENLKVKDGIDINSTDKFAYYVPGDIIMINSDTVPDGFLSCDGSTITQNAYPALFSVLGTYYDTASLVCKLPKLNFDTWIFPCSIVGNEISYPVASSSHSHTTATTAIGSDNYSTALHSHAVTTNSLDQSANHNHGNNDSAPAPNVSSTLANRSNGSGQGTNLAIYGHTHGWSSNIAYGAANDTHSHAADFSLSSPASSHTHNATLSTSSSSNEYIPGSVISMRYYIKY